MEENYKAIIYDAIIKAEKETEEQEAILINEILRPFKLSKLLDEYDILLQDGCSNKLAIFKMLYASFLIGYQVSSISNKDMKNKNLKEFIGADNKDISELY